MAIYDPTVPPLFLSGKVTKVIGKDLYPYTDATGIRAAGAYMTYEITVNQISYQSIGTADTRSGNAKQYNGLDIKAGDWTTSTNGQIVFQIDSIVDKTEGTLTFIAKDVDMTAYKTYASTYMAVGDGIAFFEMSDNRVPLLTTAAIQGFFNTSTAIDKIQGRFAAEEETERYRFEFPTAQLDYNVGDIITVSTSTGAFVKYGSVGASNVPVGVVLDKIMGDTVIYVKPFNTLIDNHTSPQLLTGSAGEIYYADPANPGAISTTKYPGAMPLFLQVKDAKPTIVEATVSNYLPTAYDVVKINTVTVFDGSIHLVPASVDAFVNLINTQTAAHLTTARKRSEFATVYSDSTTAANGFALLAISDNGGATYDPVVITVSDGTNSTTVTFDENQGVALVPFPDDANYLTYTASTIAQVLNVAFQADGLELEADAILPGDGAYETVYGRLVIRATSATASIEITSTDPDVLGGTFINGVGISASTPAGGADYLILERLDGGDIMISGVGDYINNYGITSSSAGSPPVVLMLEGVDKEQETGVNVSVDKNQAVDETTNTDHFVTGVDMDFTPFKDSDVIVKVNGIEVNVGDGDNTEDCYFTDPNDPAFNENGDPMPARLIKDIQAGDILIWNTAAAGYKLDPIDDIDIIYQASSYDVN